MKKKYLIISSIAIVIFISLFTVNEVFTESLSKQLSEAENHFNLGEYEKSIEVYKMILSNEPLHVVARFKLAESNVAIGDLDMAEEVILAGIKLLPDEQKFYSYLSTLYIQQGDFFQAVTILDNGIAATKSDELKNRLAATKDRFVIDVEQSLLQNGFETSFELTWQEEQKRPIVVKTEWEVENNAVGKIINDTDGTLRFISTNVGGTKVQSTIGSLKFEFFIQVRDQVLAEMILEGEIEQPIAVSQELTLTLIGYDVTGELMDFSPVWTLKNNLGSLSTSTGAMTTFIAESTGTETISIVTYEGIKKEFDITIVGELKDFTYSVVGKGTVTISPSENHHIKGSKITIVAEPMDGWEFASWDGDLTGTSNTVTLSIEKNMIVQALFEVQKHSLNMHTLGKGKISRSSLTNTFEHNALVTLTANPEPGWKFVRWEGDVSRTATQITVQMNNSKTITAVFAEEKKELNPAQPIVPEPTEATKPTEPGETVIPDKTYSLIAQITGEGQVSRNLISDNYKSGTSVNLIAVPNEGWKFERWEGDASGKSTSITVTMNANKTVQAIFTKEEKPPTMYNLTTSISGEGTIIRSNNNQTFVEGSEVTLTANPKDGWTFLLWDGDISSTNTTVVISMNGNRHLNAIFIQRETE